MFEKWSLPRLFMAIIIFWIVLISVQAQRLVQRCAPAECWGGWVLGRAQPGRGKSLQHLPSPHSSADKTYVYQTPEKQPGVKGQRWEPLMCKFLKHMVLGPHFRMTFKCLITLNENVCIWRLNEEKPLKLIHKGEKNMNKRRYYWIITTRAETNLNSQLMKIVNNSQVFALC